MKIKFDGKIVYQATKPEVTAFNSTFSKLTLRLIISTIFELLNFPLSSKRIFFLMNWAQSQIVLYILYFISCDGRGKLPQSWIFFMCDYTLLNEVGVPGAAAVEGHSSSLHACCPLCLYSRGSHPTYCHANVQEGNVMVTGVLLSRPVENKIQMDGVWLEWKKWETVNGEQ